MTTYFYDDAGRVTKTVVSSAWTPEDRALMMAWRAYQDSLCPGCGYPRDVAWHPFMEGWFEQEELITCWACTARQIPGEDGTREHVTYPVVVDTRDHDNDPLPVLT